MNIIRFFTHCYTDHNSLPISGLLRICEGILWHFLDFVLSIFLPIYSLSSPSSTHLPLNYVRTTTHSISGCKFFPFHTLRSLRTRVRRFERNLFSIIESRFQKLSDNTRSRCSIAQGIPICTCCSDKYYKQITLYPAPRWLFSIGVIITFRGKSSSFRHSTMQACDVLISQRGKRRYILLVTNRWARLRSSYHTECSIRRELIKCWYEKMRVTVLRTNNNELKKSHIMTWA